MKRNVFGIAEVTVHTIASQVLKRQAEYMDYINNHVVNVKKAYIALCDNTYINSTYNHDLRLALDELKFKISQHDESKYGDEEFEAYRKHFYPVKGESVSDNDEEFEIAWKHHYTVNTHHPEHWYHDGVADDMPLVDILEMICDWESFSYIGKDGAKAFWMSENGKEKKEIMSQNTIKQVERIMKMIE